VLEIENLDARPGWVDRPGMLVGTRHFALQTTRAFCRINVKRLLHGVSSMNCWVSPGTMCRGLSTHWKIITLLSGAVIPQRSKCLQHLVTESYESTTDMMGGIA
jgi:hypothetical protein